MAAGSSQPSGPCQNGTIVLDPPVLTMAERRIYRSHLGYSPPWLLAVKTCRGSIYRALYAVDVQRSLPSWNVEIRWFSGRRRGADNRKCSCSGNNVQGEKRNEGWRVNEEAGTRFSFKKEGSLRNWWIVLYELRTEVYHPLTKTL